MDIPTDTDTTDIPTDVTIGRFLSLSQSLAILSKLANFYPPFELSTNQQLLPSKILKCLFFSKNILLQTSSFGRKNFSFFLKWDPCKATSSVLLSGYNIQLSDCDIV